MESSASVSDIRMDHLDLSPRQPIGRHLQEMACNPWIAERRATSWVPAKAGMTGNNF